MITENELYYIRFTENELYYDFGLTLSKNALINFILSHRGVGKTFGFKKYAINDFLKTGKQFMYVRRFKSELKTIHSFFSDIYAEFPEHKFAVKGGNAGGQFLIDDKVAGYFYPLSTAFTLKSTPFPNVNKMCMDEFIITKGHQRYIQDEVTAFFDLIETINRLRTSEKLHDLLRVFCMANTISIVNPYFQYFDIIPNAAKRYTVFPKYNNDVLIELYRNVNFIAEKKNTRMGAIMDRVPYGKYAIEGEFYQDDKSFIAKRSPASRCMLNITCQGQEISFWFDYQDGKIYACKKPNPSALFNFALTSADHKPNHFLIKNATHCAPARALVEGFQNGCLYFDDLNTKAIAFKILQYLSIRSG